MEKHFNVRLVNVSKGLEESTSNDYKFAIHEWRRRYEIPDQVVLEMIEKGSSTFHSPRFSGEIVELRLETFDGPIDGLRN
jgi:hypothetical protein